MLCHDLMEHFMHVFYFLFCLHCDLLEIVVLLMAAALRDCEILSMKLWQRLSIYFIDACYFNTRYHYNT
jgi:hypothetical protein